MPDPSGPADTVMMAIMHDALRRDFARTRVVLAMPEPLSGDRRAAVARHVAFMLDFLHDHHHNEDDLLWPTVRALDPSLGELLDAMSADHLALAGDIDALRDAARRLETDGSEEARAATLADLDRLSSVLLPHLAREDAEMMPRVSDCMTVADWQAFERSAMPPYSKRVLAEYVNWFLDDLDEPRRRRAMAALPAPIVFVMTRVLGPGYRRRAQVRWGDLGPLTVAGAATGSGGVTG